MKDQTLAVLLGKLKQWEGEVKSGSNHVSYQDDADVWTIGHGHTGDDVGPGTVWTDGQAEKAFNKDLSGAISQYDRLVTADLNPNQQAAVLSLIFNVGGGAFEKSKALANLNANDFDGFTHEAFDADEGFTKVTKDGLKAKSSGLVNRRGFERDLYASPWEAPVIEEPTQAIDPPEAPPPFIDRPNIPDFVEPDLPEATAPRFTLEQKAEIQAEAEDKSSQHGWWDMFGRSFESDNSIGIIGNALDDHGAVYDPTFKFDDAMTTDKDRIDVLRETGDAEEIGDRLGRAVSPEHFENLLAHLEHQRETEVMFAEAGIKGLSARLIPALLDPVDIAVGFVTGGLGHAKRLTKLGAVLRGAAGAGASNATIEAMAAVNNPYRDKTDVMYAFGAGMVLGGPLGLLSTKGNKQLRKLSEAALREDMAYEAARSAANIAHKNGDGGAARSALDAATREGTDDVDFDIAKTSVDRAEEITQKAGNPGEFRWLWAQKLQRNYIGRLFGSANETIKNVAPRILEGGLLVDKKATRAFTAEGRMNNIHQTASTRFFTNTQPMFVEWAKKNGFNTIQREAGIEANEKFYTEVGSALRGQTDGVSGEAAAAAAKVKPILDEFHAMAKEAGLPGFDGDAVENFFPRHWDQTKLSSVFEGADDKSVSAWFKGALLEEFEANPRPKITNETPESAQAIDDSLAGRVQELDNKVAELEQAVAGAEATLAGFKPRQKGIAAARKAAVEARKELRKANSEKVELDSEVSARQKPEDDMEALAERIAEGFVKGLRRNNANLNADISRGIDLDDADLMRDLFQGVDDELVEILTARIQRQASEADNGDAGNIRHGRNRLRFSENFKGKITMRDKSVKELTLDDMTITDAGKILPRYFRTMGGWLGLAKEAGIKSQADVNALMAKMSLEGATHGEVEAFADSIKLVTGRSVADNPNGIGDRVGRIAAAYDYTRFGGSFGVAQIPELGNIIGEVGIINFIRGIPEFASLMRRAKNGTLDNALARELEELIAPGTDFTIGHARSNFDEHGLGYGDKKALKKMDGLLARGGRVTSIVSLMGPITSALERIATKEIVTNWGRFANGTKNVAEWKGARFRAAGISDEMRDKIFANMKKHGKYDGDKLIELNTDAWDRDVLDSFRLGLDRTRRYAIQRNDLGNTGKFIHQPLGRMLTRFMNFMLNSVNKQLIKGVHHADIQTFVSFSTSMFLGGLAYTAQTSIDYAGNDEKRKERLDPRRIAAAAYSRAGFSAITIPIIDSTLALAGKDQIFNYGRTSGLGSDFITGNTSLTGAQDIVSTATLPLRMLLNDDYRFSQDDFDRIQRLIPFQRVLGVKNAFHAIEDGYNLPKSSTTQ